MEVGMLRYSSLLAIGMTLFSMTAFAQMGPLGPSGDFRVDGRQGTVPTAGPTGGPSLPPGPAAFKDTLGVKSADDILKGINQELGKNSFDRSDSWLGNRALDVNKALQSPSDYVFK